MEKSKKKRVRAVIMGVILLSAFYFGPSFFGGYYWTESAASEQSYHNTELVEVYRKKVDDRKVIIQDNGFLRVAKVIDRPLGLFYQVELATYVSAATSDEKMKFGWTAIQKQEEYYEVLLAVEAMDENIEKVIVTNEYPEQKDASVDELKELSDLFIEMEVENGYAAHYLELPNSEAGGFEFRGINAEGEVISES
ncbi:hypothetical protein [Planococcus lenghuensis]|uniref:Uncharacterized protein n=1 Tax=Planococcus lenghuensis TaxID=2213202 RepID=A0A1Q2KY72_9BACL|nr:hypothetical protein [Planococcus lenghuensis]AQQ53151.1 hypothetical protein B0X71_08635 [Planococcus lenghuensis]